MTSDDSLDRKSLSSNTVAQLREICKERGLMVSGKKADLVDRILEDAGEEEFEDLKNEESKGDKSWEEDALVLDEDSEETKDKADEAISRIREEVIEAEVVEAELVTNVPEITSDDDKPSFVITTPTLSSLGERWKATSAVIVVAVLVVASATIFLQRSSGFTVSKLHYGDSMEFNVMESSVSIVGEEMLDLVRDYTGEILEDACDELSIEISDGSGSVSITNGPESGAMVTTDSLGRSGHLSVEKRINMDLTMDFEGKTWRDDEKTDCGNIMWLLPDNELSIDSTSWVELEKGEVKRSDTSILFKDVDSKTTNFRAVTYDDEGIGGIGALIPTLSFPLSPVELYDFFGDVVIKDGASSSDPDLNWNSDWEWEVKGELRDDLHGLVYKVEMQHEDFGRCYGHAQVTLLVKKGSPWPVNQQSNILLDKDLQTGSCDFLVSTLSDEILPEGTLSISMTYSKSESSSGNNAIDWERDYWGSPTESEDRPRSSTKKNWVDSMWDESEIRQFDLQEALSCMKVTYPDNQATQALESGGYIWDAKWSRPTGEPEWNLSWVDEDDNSGWLVLQRIQEGCEILSSDSNDRGEVKWSDSKPSTHTLAILEERVLTEGRYPVLAEYIKSGESWHVDTTVGYRLSAIEDNDYLSLLPGDLADGKVAMIASREWESSGRSNSVEMAMDSETGEMILWFKIERVS